MYLETPDSFLLEEDSRVILVHGSPGKYKSRFNYILSPEDLLKPAKFMSKRNMKICFFGHTHKQVLWEVDNEGISLLEFNINEPVIFTEDELKNSKLIINPGSVGQPRDHIPESAYLVYEQKNNAHIFTFKRVDYDIEKTVNKIYDIKELDDRLGDRLFIGA
jgi:predicted phosphodiesterase